MEENRKLNLNRRALYRWERKLPAGRFGKLCRVVCQGRDRSLLVEWLGDQKRDVVRPLGLRRVT